METRGYGHALMGGIEQAHGKYLIMADADDSYDFSRLDGFIDQLDPVATSSRDAGCLAGAGR